jgi:hypothetical protein
VIDRLADTVERRSEEFARRVSSQNGMPVFMSVLFDVSPESYG